ncbi:GNAT family N-acetyltransferase [Knoellia sp. CPCC 206453]|uniref:GNAT family N-acetyltransferase n=1 Tax=Knoellia pratensis TaxID=3404796 RepID=UPI0036203F8E
MAISIVPVTTLDPAQAELAEAWNAVFVASAVAAMGDDHDTWSMASRRARESTSNWDRRYLAAVDSDDQDRVVAGAELTLPLRDNPELALIDVVVHPEHRRHGLGTALLDHITQQARDAGRTSLALETAYPRDGADPGEVFACLHGFDLAQTNHRNDLDVTAYSFQKPSETAGYAIETSTDDTLDEWLEDRANLQRRMSTDAPTGDLDFGEEDWDADRIRGQRDATRSSNRRAVESVARHVATGRLVAFTQLQIPTAEPELAYQQDTLVLREHRGHGLGAALKAANMLALRTEFPQTRTVRTWNAVENGPMIAVNEALGYRTTAIQREWQKRLA